MTPERIRTKNDATADIEHVAEMRTLLAGIGIRPNNRGELCERDASIYLGCSLRTMYAMRRREDGPRYVRLFGRYWYPLEGLAEYVTIRMNDPD